MRCPGLHRANKESIRPSARDARCNARRLNIWAVVFQVWGTGLKIDVRGGFAAALRILVRDLESCCVADLAMGVDVSTDGDDGDGNGSQQNSERNEQKIVDDSIVPPPRHIPTLSILRGRRRRGKQTTAEAHDKAAKPTRPSDFFPSNSTNALPAQRRHAAKLAWPRNLLYFSRDFPSISHHRNDSPCSPPRPGIQSAGQLTNPTPQDRGRVQQVTTYFCGEARWRRSSRES